VLRNLDVGTYYAGVRPFFFSLLIRSREQSPIGVTQIEKYAAPGAVAPALTHRPDGLKNLSAIGVLTWDDLGAVLESAANNAHREDERVYASRARAWLRERGVIFHT
jgi:hypothetical protein